MYTLNTPLPSKLFRIKVSSEKEWNKVKKYFSHHNLHWANHISFGQSTENSYLPFWVIVTNCRYTSKCAYMASSHNELPFELKPTTDITDEFFSESLTNEEVLAIFLKQYRKYSFFKRHVDFNDKTTIPVNTVISNWFVQANTNLTSDWLDLNRKFKDLCKKFKLKGTIQYNKLPK